LAPNATKLNNQASIKLLKMSHQSEQSSSLHLKQQSIQANALRLIGLIVDTYGDVNYDWPNVQQVIGQEGPMAS
jgi:hypothetical protein